MSVLKTEAITLGRTDYSDSSQIIVFYTRDYGKIHTIAKGFKRTSRKHGTKTIDLLTCYQILFIKKEHSSLYTLTEAILLNNYQPVRNDLDKYYKASYIAELVKEFTEENDINKPFYDIFLDTLNGISDSTNSAVWLLSFELKMLKVLGYLPDLRGCINCKNSIKLMREVLFNAKEGGMLCELCQSTIRNGMVVPAGAVVIANKLVDVNIHRLERVKIQSSICIEIEKMLRYYITYILSKETNSCKYITFR